MKKVLASLAFFCLAAGICFAQIPPSYYVNIVPDEMWIAREAAENSARAEYAIFRQRFNSTLIGQARFNGSVAAAGRSINLPMVVRTTQATRQFVARRIFSPQALAVLALSEAIEWTAKKAIQLCNEGGEQFWCTGGTGPGGDPGTGTWPQGYMWNVFPGTPFFLPWHSSPVGACRAVTNYVGAAGQQVDFEFFWTEGPVWLCQWSCKESDGTNCGPIVYGMSVAESDGNEIDDSPALPYTRITEADFLDLMGDNVDPNYYNILPETPLSNSPADTQVPLGTPTFDSPFYYPIGPSIRDPDTGLYHRPWLEVTENPQDWTRPSVRPVTTTSDDPAHDPNNQPGGGTETPSEKSDFCLEHPNVLACAQVDLDTPDADKLDAKEIDLSWKPVTIGFENGSCPAPETVTLSHIGTLSLSYQPVCDWARLIRPMVLLVGWFCALVILGGAFKDE